MEKNKLYKCLKVTHRKIRDKIIQPLELKELLVNLFEASNVLKKKYQAWRRH